MKKRREPLRGEVYIANLNPVIGSEQGGIRPVLILQNNMGNQYSPTVICASFTCQKNKANIPTHVHIQQPFVEGTLLLEQIRTISKTRLQKRLGVLSDMSQVDEALRLTLAC